MTPLPSSGDNQPAVPAASPAREHSAPPLPVLTFVGFGILEGFLDALDSARPVYAMALVEAGPSHGGIQTDELLVVCQQIARDGSVWYCRLRAASMTRCFGNPFDPDWQDREAAWHSLWQAVQECLQERSLTPTRATIAHPRHFTLLQGQSTTIRYDKQSKRYKRDTASARPS